MRQLHKADQSVLCFVLGSSLSPLRRGSCFSDFASSPPCCALGCEGGHSALVVVVAVLGSRQRFVIESWMQSNMVDVILQIWSSLKK